MLPAVAEGEGIKRIPAPLDFRRWAKKIEGGGRRQVKIPETSLQPDLDKNRLTAQPANIRPVHSGQEYVVQTGHLQPKKEKALEQDTTPWQGTLSSADPRVKAAQSSPPRSKRAGSLVLLHESLNAFPAVEEIPRRRTSHQRVSL